MEGLILNEDAEFFTYLSSVLFAIGTEVIEGLNWRVTCAEYMGKRDDDLPFDNERDIWLTGKELLEIVNQDPDTQWVWGLLQGFSPMVDRAEVCECEPIDIRLDTIIWENPVSLRNPKAEIEIEAFDSSLTIVIAKDEAIIKRLTKEYPKAESLYEYNIRL